MTYNKITSSKLPFQRRSEKDTIYKETRSLSLKKMIESTWKEYRHLDKQP